MVINSILNLLLSDRGAVFWEMASLINVNKCNELIA